ncbi:Aspartic proteinase-like protein 1, partial [Nymphaea thermarum]
LFFLFFFFYKNSSSPHSLFPFLRSSGSPPHSSRPAMAFAGVSPLSSTLLFFLVLLFLFHPSVGKTTFSFELHHKFSDQVRDWVRSTSGVSVDNWPQPGSPEYYNTLFHHDRVLRGRNLAASSTPLVTFVDGNLTLHLQLGFLHYAMVEIGTPAVKFLVALDTGSDLFWVPCQCIQCANSSSPLVQGVESGVYSPNISTTGKYLPCSSDLCDSRTLCSGTNSQCPYKVDYVSANTSSSGVLVEDVLHLITEDSQPKAINPSVVFGCGRIQTGAFLRGPALNGLFGLGLGNQSVPSILAKSGLIANSFSMCFGSDGFGRINFGDKGTSDQEETPFVVAQSHLISKSRILVLLLIPQLRLSIVMPSENFMSGHRIVFNRESGVLGYNTDGAATPSVKSPAMSPTSAVSPSAVNPEATTTVGNRTQIYATSSVKPSSVSSSTTSSPIRCANGCAPPPASPSTTGRSPGVPSTTVPFSIMIGSSLAVISPQAANLWLPSFVDGNLTHHLQLGFEVLVALDTGSNLFWVPCQCIQCANFTSPLGIKGGVYSPNVSTTGKYLPCSSHLCDSRTLCPGTNSHCPYRVAYASANTSSSGVLVEDVLHLITEDSQPKAINPSVVFGCGQIQTGAFLRGPALNGLFGLGLGSVSVPSILAKSGLIANSFSMCFGSDGFGRINFGDKGTSDQEETPFVVSQSHPTYQINVTDIRVGAGVISIRPGFLPVFDTGTSFTYLADPLYTAIGDSFDKQVQDPRSTLNSTAPFEYCYAISSNQNYILIPKINMTMSGGANFNVLNPIVVLSSQVRIVSIYVFVLVWSCLLTLHHLLVIICRAKIYIA